MASPACPQPCWPHCPPTEGLGREQCHGPSRSRSYCVQEPLILQALAQLPTPHPLVPRTGDEFPNWRPGALPLAARGETQDSPCRWDSFPKGTEEQREGGAKDSTTSLPFSTGTQTVASKTPQLCAASVHQTRSLGPQDTQRTHFPSGSRSQNKPYLPPRQPQPLPTHRTGPQANPHPMMA